MKNTIVLGTLDLSDNRLDDVSAPLAYPDCERMILRNGFGVYNPDRFEALPYLAEGIDCRPGTYIWKTAIWPKCWTNLL